MLKPSAASSAIMCTVDASLVASSSKCMGMLVLRCSEMLSRHVTNGAYRTESRPLGRRRSMWRAVSALMQPLASTRKNPPVCLLANEAAMPVDFDRVPDVAPYPVVCHSLVHLFGHAHTDG